MVAGAWGLLPARRAAPETGLLEAAGACPPDLPATTWRQCQSCGECRGADPFL